MVTAETRCEMSTRTVAKGSNDPASLDGAHRPRGAASVKSEHLNLANECSNVAAACSGAALHSVAAFFDHAARWHRDRAARCRVLAPVSQHCDMVDVEGIEDTHPLWLIPQLERLLRKHEALGHLTVEVQTSGRRATEQLAADEALAISRVVTAIRKITVVANRSRHLSQLDRWMDREGRRLFERMQRPGPGALCRRQA